MGIPRVAGAVARGQMPNPKRQDIPAKPQKPTARLVVLVRPLPETGRIAISLTFTA